MLVFLRRGSFTREELLHALGDQGAFYELPIQNEILIVGNACKETPYSITCDNPTDHWSKRVYTVQIAT